MSFDPQNPSIDVSSALIDDNSVNRVGSVHGFIKDVIQRYPYEYPRRTSIIEHALSRHYHDFESFYTHPKTQLIMELGLAKMHDLVDLAAKGRYDDHPEDNIIPPSLFINNPDY